MKPNPRPKLKTLPSYAQALAQLVQQQRLLSPSRRRRRRSQMRSISSNSPPDLRICSRPPQLVFSNKDTNRDRERKRASFLNKKSAITTHLDTAAPSNCVINECFFPALFLLVDVDLSFSSRRVCSFKACFARRDEGSGGSGHMLVGGPSAWARLGPGSSKRKVIVDGWMDGCRQKERIH